MSSPAFLQKIRDIEERLFGEKLDPTDSSRIRNDNEYSWLYRPSHHAKTGLISEADIAMLQKTDARLLSIGAAPAALEQVICELGLPPKKITIADKNLGVLSCSHAMNAVHFDMTENWPEIGLFDLILFPESLCIAIRDRMMQDGIEKTSERSASDKSESIYLAHILGAALRILKPNGEIRANGPMSHPNVVRGARAILEKDKYLHVLTYERFFLSVRHTNSNAEQTSEKGLM